MKTQIKAIVSELELSPDMEEWAIQQIDDLLTTAVNQERERIKKLLENALAGETLSGMTSFKLKQITSHKLTS